MEIQKVAKRVKAGCSAIGLIRANEGINGIVLELSPKAKMDKLGQEYHLWWRELHRTLKETSLASRHNGPRIGLQMCIRTTPNATTPEQHVSQHSHGKDIGMNIHRSACVFSNEPRSFTNI